MDIFGEAGFFGAPYELSLRYFMMFLEDHLIVDLAKHFTGELSLIFLNIIEMGQRGLFFWAIVDFKNIF